MKFLLLSFSIQIMNFTNCDTYLSVHYYYVHFPFEQKLDLDIHTVKATLVFLYKVALMLWNLLTLCYTPVIARCAASHFLIFPTVPELMLTVYFSIIMSIYMCRCVHMYTTILPSWPVEDQSADILLILIDSFHVSWK